MNKKELTEELARIGIDHRFYSLDGSLEPDRIIMKNYHGIWEVFYFDERGNIHKEKKFSSEDEACRYIYDYFLDSPASIPGKKKMDEKVSKLKTKSPIKTPDVIELK